MGRRVFFSFHPRDLARANQVIGGWRSSGSVEDQLDHASVTVILIGAQTADQRSILDEIERAFALGKGLLGIRIHRLRDEDGVAGELGADPFAQLTARSLNGRIICFSQFVQIYDYVADNGSSNLAQWVEGAAVAAGV